MKLKNTFKNTLINACFMSIKHLPTTILVVCMNCMVFICALVNSYTFYYGMMIYVFIGFALVAYMNSIFLSKVFENYYEAPTYE